MHPTFSIIFFTVVSEAGFGLATLFALLKIAGRLDAYSAGQQLVMLGVAVGLVTAGLASSTLHLANPKNAWRAVMRVRTSWLSREALAALAFYPVVGAFAMAIAFQAPRGWLNILGLATAMLAQVTVLTTSMIYASLKTMRIWNNPLVPANCHVLSLASGAAIMSSLAASMSGQLSELAVVAPLLIIVALLGKWLYFAWIDRDNTLGSTMQTATGLSRAAVRLLDLGHTAGNFTTREFGYRTSPRARQGARLIVYAGFIGAALLFSAFDSASAFLTLPLATFLTMLAVFAERWLCFVEAKQAVMLYHGSAHERPHQSTRTLDARRGNVFASGSGRSQTTARSPSGNAKATRAISAD